MPYARQYDVAEVKGMLMIAEGSSNVVSNRVYAKKKKKKEGRLPIAHSVGSHVAQSAAELSKRVDGGPAVASTFNDFDTLVLATTEALNHANGQVALARLDGGHIDATFLAPLAGNQYYGSRSTRVGAQGSGQSNSDPFMVASEVFVKVVRFVGGRLWIQT